MGTVTIGGVNYTVYGEHTGVGSLTEYANGSLTYAVMFAAAPADNQKRAMVSATAVLKRQPWADPAHGDPATVGLPTAIINAGYELALAMLAGKVDPQTGGSQAGNVKSVDDGVVALTFFGPGGQTGASLAWMDLIAPYLANGGVNVGATTASGVDGESDFDADDTFSITSA